MGGAAGSWDKTGARTGAGDPSTRAGASDRTASQTMAMPRTATAVRPEERRSNSHGLGSLRVTASDSSAGCIYFRNYNATDVHVLRRSDLAQVEYLKRAARPGRVW